MSHDDLFGSDDTRQELFNEAQQIAQLHSIFDTGPGASLLNLWKTTYHKPVPVNATIDEYARAEAMRAFLATIEAQIKFYKTEGR